MPSYQNRRLHETFGRWSWQTNIRFSHIWIYISCCCKRLAERISRNGRVMCRCYSLPVMAVKTISGASRGSMTRTRTLASHIFKSTVTALCRSFCNSCSNILLFRIFIKTVCGELVPIFSISKANATALSWDLLKQCAKPAVCRTPNPHFASSKCFQNKTLRSQYSKKAF